MKKWLLGWALLCLAQTLSAQDILKEDSLQEVVVTGTGTQHLLKDAPIQTEVISRQMLRNFSGSSVADILSGLTSSFAFNEGHGQSDADERSGQQLHTYPYRW